MVDRSKILAMLKGHEDVALKPYRDTVGKLTIGIGRNLDDRGISFAEAEYLCNNDIDEVTGQLQHSLQWFDSAPEPVQLVLIDMCFNMGIAGLLEFRKTLDLLQTGQYQLAAQEMLNSKWAKQVGTRATYDSNLIKSIQ
jgi:lysozyme